MTSSKQLPKQLTWFQSIRWRLPLTYAAIVLLTVTFLASVLLFTLDQYYTSRETVYLTNTARAFAGRIERLYLEDQITSEALSPVILPVSFLSRSRIRLLDEEGQVVFDSTSVATFETFVLSMEPNFSIQLPEEGRHPVPPGDNQFTIQIGRQAAREDGEGRYRMLGSEYLLWASDAPFGYNFAETEEPPEVLHSDVVVSVPLHNHEGQVIAHLELSEGPAFGTDVIRGVVRYLLLAVALVVPLAILIGWRISHSISQPIMRLTRATEQMAEGDLRTRVQIERGDELGRLSNTFNNMACQVETTVNTLQQFVADAAHEIKTPITAMRTNLELAEGGITDDNSRSDLALAQRELNRLENLTSSLLALARLESGSVESAREPLDLARIVRQIHEHFASRAEQAGVMLEVRNAAQPSMIEGDSGQIIRALENLVDNAVKFTPEGGSVTIGLDTTSQSGNVQLYVQDTGVGIPDSEVPRLFSRFHRGRNVSAYPGNGLGLVIVKKIVEDHGGQITVQSGGGSTTFLVTLPVH